MRQLLNGIAGLLFMMNLPASVLAGWDPNEAKEAQEAIAAFMATDPELQRFFDKAHGYAVSRR